MNGLLSMARLMVALTFTLAFTIALTASPSFAKYDSWQNMTDRGQHGSPKQGSSGGEQELIDAQQRGQGLHYAEVHQVQVIRILPDDNKGSRHQKWVVRLSNGSTLLAVYNISICDRVPVREGMLVSMGGQYIWDNRGGLLHWLHEDPRNKRPHGWVEVNGVRYGKVIRR